MSAGANYTLISVGQVSAGGAVSTSLVAFAAGTQLTAPTDGTLQVATSTGASGTVLLGTGVSLFSSGANVFDLSLGGAAALEAAILSNNIQFSNKIGSSAGNGFFFYAANGGLAGSIDASNGIMSRSAGISSGNSAAPLGQINWTGVPTPNGAFGMLTAATVQSGALSGASVTLSSLIPAGSLVVGVVSRVTTAITGATSFSIGDAAAGTQYGATLPITLGSTSTNANTTLTSPKFYPTATSIVLTANGSNFTAGVVRVTVYYIALAAPTS